MRAYTRSSFPIPSGPSFQPADKPDRLCGSGGGCHALRGVWGVGGLRASVLLPSLLQLPIDHHRRLLLLQPHQPHDSASHKTWQQQYLQDSIGLCRPEMPCIPLQLRCSPCAAQKIHRPRYCSITTRCTPLSRFRFCLVQHLRSSFMLPLLHVCITVKVQSAFRFPGLGQ
jgi:hypothetical protein